MRPFTFMTSAILALLIVVTPHAESATEPLRGTEEISTSVADAKAAIPQLSGLECTTPVSAYGSTICTVSLSAVVPGVLNKGGESAVVALTWPTGSRDVSLLPGQTHGSVAVAMNNDSPFSVPVVIQARYQNVTKTVTVTILAGVLKSLEIQPKEGLGGSSSYAPKGIVRLSAPPQGGLKVRLDSDSPAVVSVPSTVTVPSGQTEASFPIGTKLVASTTSVKITASVNWQGDVDQTSYTMTILPTVLKSLAIQPDQGIGGDPNYAPKGIVTLSAPAPQGGFKVRLGGDSPAVVTVDAANAMADMTAAGAPTTVVIIPSVVTVPSGQTEASFTIGTKPVTLNTWVHITASSNSQNTADQASRVIVIKSPPRPDLRPYLDISGVLNVFPLGGSPVKVTAFLSSPPVVDVTVDLNYLGTVTGPSKVEIPSGHTERKWTITVFPCATEQCGVSIKATAPWNGDQAHTNFTYHNPAAAASTSSQVGQAGATPTVRWTTAPNATLKEATGRAVVNFLKDVEYRFSQVEIFPTGGTTATKKGYGSSEMTLPPSRYDVVVNGARVAQVPITPGTDTRLLVGALRIQAGEKTRVEVWDDGRTKLLVWTIGNGAIGLPVGHYSIKIGKGTSAFNDVIIEDGKTTDFRAQ